MRIQFYIVNLPEDTDQFERLSAGLSKFDFACVNRVESVRGRLLADTVAHLLTRNAYSHNYKGVLGCFLGHISAWERIARSDAPYSVVLEDDVDLQNIDVLRNLSPPDAFDIAFCNDRTAYPLGEDSALAGGYTFRDLLPSLEFVETYNLAIGSDGYLLSPSGAKKLLSYVAEDTLFSHIDLRLMAYSLDPDQAKSLDLKKVIATGVYSLQATYSRAHRLTAYSLFPPLTVHPKQVGISRRDVEDRAGGSDS